MGETFSEQKVSGEHVNFKWGLLRWKEEKWSFIVEHLMKRH